MTIAPDASPGIDGVDTFSVTACDWPGASEPEAGLTVPNVVYRAALAPKMTFPVVPPSLESRL